MTTANDTRQTTFFDTSMLGRRISIEERLNGPYRIEIMVGFRLALMCSAAAVLVLLLVAAKSTFWLIALPVTIFTIVMFRTFIRVGAITRTHEFATRNHMTYRQSVAYDNRPGIVFQNGRARYFPGLLTRQSGEPIEVGNFYSQTGRGRNTRTFQFGFVRVRLAGSAPNIVLDSRKNKLQSQLFTIILNNMSKTSQLSINQDFDSYFRIYTLESNQVVVRAILNPSVQQTLTSVAGKYDYEVVGDSVYAIWTGRLYLTDAPMISDMTGKALAIADALRPHIVPSTISPMPAEHETLAAARKPPRISRDARRFVSLFVVVCIIAAILEMVLRG